MAEEKIKTPKKKKHIWAWVLGIIAFLIILSLFQGNEYNVNDSNNEVIKGTETITITGIDQTDTINKPDKIISIEINGINNSNLNELIKFGSSNISFKLIFIIAYKSY